MLRLTSPQIGFLAALFAYLLWGINPLYFKQVVSVTPEEILAHRIVGCFFFTTLWILLQGKLSAIRESASALKHDKRLILTGFLLSSNWLLFTWAVLHDQVLEASLGYYINPLLSVFFGAVFLKENLRRSQKIAVIIATIAVLQLVIREAVVPWISLILATSFALYGLIRKQTAIGPVRGLWAEMLVLLPFALGYFIYLLQTGSLQYGQNPTTDGWLLLAGVVSGMPLILFAASTKRLNLSTVGMMQYIAPSMAFMLAIFLFGERMSDGLQLTFIGIWVALFIYAAGQLRGRPTSC